MARLVSHLVMSFTYNCGLWRPRKCFLVFVFKINQTMLTLTVFIRPSIKLIPTAFDKRRY